MEIFAIAALSADGFIAQSSDQVSTQWTSKEDAAWFAQKTKAAQYCVMGRTTYQTFNRPLKDRTLLVLSKNAPHTIDVHSLVLGSVVETSLSPQELVAALEKLSISQLAVCGGSSIYTQFLKEHLVNKLFLTIEPILFGKGITFCNENLELSLRLQELHRLSDQTIVLEYQVST